MPLQKTKKGEYILPHHDSFKLEKNFNTLHIVNENINTKPKLIRNQRFLSFSKRKTPLNLSSNIYLSNKI